MHHGVVEPAQPSHPRVPGSMAHQGGNDLGPLVFTDVRCRKPHPQHVADHAVDPDASLLRHPDGRQ